MTSRLREWWMTSLFPGVEHGPEPMSRAAWLGLAALLVLAGGLLFHGLSYPLLEPDEGRYAEIGREMVSTGDWIVPRFNQRPYLDKPPLFYWLVALSVSLFGAHDWVPRLVPATATFLTILATFFFGRRLLGTRRALLGSFTLALMGGVVLVARILILDAVLTLTVILALFTAYEAVRSERLHRGWWVLSAFFCGLGVLVKGPVAVILALPPLLAESWFRQRPGRPKLGHCVLYGLVVLAVFAPWFIAVSLQFPDFPEYFIVNQHLVRYLGQEHHPQPLWFYVPVLLGGCLPWSPLLVPMTWFLCSSRTEYRDRRTAGMGLLLLFAAWCLTFFSFSRGKLAPYILPAMSPLALLLGCYLDLLLFTPVPVRGLQRINRWLPRLMTAPLTAGAVGLMFWVSASAGQLWPPYVILSLGVIMVVGLVAYGGKLRPRWGWGVCGLATVGLLLTVTSSFLPAFSTQRSPFSRKTDIEAIFRDRNLAVAFLPEFGSIPFLLNHDGHVLHVAERPPEEIRDFLGRQPHSLLITDNDFPLDKARLFLPETMDIRHAFDSGKTRFFELVGKKNRGPTVQARAGTSVSVEDAGPPNREPKTPRPPTAMGD